MSKPRWKQCPWCGAWFLTTTKQTYCTYEHTKKFYKKLIRMEEKEERRVNRAY